MQPAADAVVATGNSQRDDIAEVLPISHSTRGMP